MAPNVAALVRLMVVTDDRWVAGRDLVDLARAAERGGATAVQLRLKHASPRALVAAARTLVAALRIPVLVNDRLDVALAAGAAGVHLGPDDLAPMLARRIVPPGFLIGVSIGSEAEAAAAGGAMTGIESGASSADYWGVGPWRETRTKGDAGTALGAPTFEAITALAGGRPCIAIGGITPGDVPTVLAAGGAGVAVVSGILAHDDIEVATRAYATALAGE